jgi:hypothetical protein
MWENLQRIGQQQTIGNQSFRIKIGRPHAVQSGLQISLDITPAVT